MADYNEFSEPEPTIKEFREKFESVAQEITPDGIKVNGRHPGMTARVAVRCENDDSEYELSGMDVTMLMGCGCWSEAIIVIKKK